MLLQSGNLLAVNQNVDQPVNGAVLRFDGSTGLQLSPPLVDQNNAQAPFAPRGMVIKEMFSTWLILSGMEPLAFLSTTPRREPLLVTWFPTGSTPHLIHAAWYSAPMGGYT